MEIFNLLTTVFGYSTKLDRNDHTFLSDIVRMLQSVCISTTFFRHTQKHMDKSALV